MIAWDEVVLTGSLLGMGCSFQPGDVAIGEACVGSQWPLLGVSDPASMEAPISDVSLPFYPCAFVAILHRTSFSSGFLLPQSQ